MKILYYSPHPTINYSAPSGPGTHIREVIKALEANGHQVLRLICGGEQMVVAASIKFKRNRIKQFVPSILWQSLKDFQLRRLDKSYQKQLEALVLKETPDLIYERGYYLMQSGFRTAKKMGIPYFCEINAPYPEEKLAMEGNSCYVRKARKTEKQQVLNSDRIFTVSSAMKEYLIRLSGCDAKKIIVTANAVNESSIVVSERIVEGIKKQYKIQSDEKIIGFVGSIFPYHGVDILLKAFEKLEGVVFEKFRLMIVGDGEILPDLRQFAATNLPKGKVIFTGNVPHKEVYNYISLMDITVMARSNWYGSPVKIFEYGAMQKVIIAPDVIPVRDVMLQNQDGILIGNQIQDLIAAITYLVENPNEAKVMAASFHKKVMKQHTWSHVANQILSELK